jgi:nucleotide-binding universal stress UspA family protein
LLPAQGAKPLKPISASYPKMATLTKRLSRAALGANVAEVHLREGPTVDEILDSGDEVRAGFIVIGSRGLGPVENLLLGSISEGVVHHHSRRPILMVLAEGGGPGRLSSTGHRGNDSVS